MSFTQGLSGLNAASKQLEVVGNNVANANTVGFKGSQAQFGDVFAAALSGAGSAQIGIGAKLLAVAQQFTQGNISVTNNTLDLAINGPGFFALQDSVGRVGYSRNGQFQLDQNGSIVSSSGAFLQGYLPDATGLAPVRTLTKISVPTGVNSANPTTQITAALNLNATGGTAGFIPVATSFDPTVPTSYNYSTATTSYDAQGRAQNTTMYFRLNNSAGSNSWDVYATVTDPTAAAGTYLFPPPPAVVTPATAATADAMRVAVLNFNPNGTYNSVVQGANAAVVGPPARAATVALTFTPPGQAVPPAVVGPAGTQTMTFSLTGCTQFGAAFGVSNLTQNGYTVGQLSGFSISPDGSIVGRYSNGTQKTVGWVALSTFKNMQGLQPLGNNQWAVTGASGNPITDVPGAGNNGVLQTGATEDSNVDLTAELVNMITAQRVYQANAQTIKTQDAVMQTLVNLR